MSDDDLADIYISRRAQLTEDARQALDNVIAERGIDIRAEVVREASDAALYAEDLARAQEKRDIRERRITRALWWIALPSVLVGYVLRPEAALETLVASAVVALGFLAVHLLVIAIRRK